MKKKFALFLSALYFTGTLMLPFAYGAENNTQKIRVYLNGDEVKFTSQSPTVVERRTLIPLRGIFEKMGYSIDWEPNTKTSTISNPLQTITIRSGHKTMQADKRSITLDVPAQIINGSLMIPLRAVAECTGAVVTWDANTKSIYVNSSNKNQIAISMDEYVKEYSDILDGLDRVNTLFKSLDALTSRNVSQRLESIRIQAENALEDIDNAYDKLKNIEAPEQYSQPNELMGDALDIAYALCSLVYDMTDDSLNYNAASLEIGALYDKTKELNAKVNEITSALNQGIYR